MHTVYHNKQSFCETDNQHLPLQGSLSLTFKCHQILESSENYHCPSSTIISVNLCPRSPFAFHIASIELKIKQTQLLGILCEEKYTKTESNKSEQFNFSARDNLQTASN